MTDIFPYDTKNNTARSFTQSFEEEYIRIRKKEQRIYTNEEVAMLPDIYPGHMHYKEWQVRKRSSEKLINYLGKKGTRLKILEIGCGNGWLSSKLAGIDNAVVTGIDINFTELRQAFEVFKKPNLSFIYGNLDDTLIDCSFDIIIFASSIQYFPSLKQIINHALSLLNSKGEIHILDTFFYGSGEVEGAIERTKSYYNALCCPGMADHYFHHTTSELKTFEPVFLNNRSVINKLLQNQDPFPWIRITKK